MTLETGATEERLSPFYEVSANGFTAISDAFAVSEEYDERSLWWLSLIGSQTTVKALTASILKANPDPLIIRTPEDAAGDPLRVPARRHQSSGHWSAKKIRLPLSRAWHAIVYSTQAEYRRNQNGNSNFLIVSTNGAEQEAEKHRKFLNSRIAVPIHEKWDHWLWNRGLQKKEIVPLTCHGAVDAWVCRPNVESLRADISEAIASLELRH